MEFRNCFNCFKRNHGKYKIPANTSSSSVQSPHKSLQSNNNLACSGSILSQQASQTPSCDDHSDLYAAIDKTKQAKNGIRIKPDTYQHSRLRSANHLKRSSNSITTSNSYPINHISISPRLSSSDPGYATIDNSRKQSHQSKYPQSHTTTPHLYINTEQSHQLTTIYQNVSFSNQIDDDSSYGYATIASISQQPTNACEPSALK